MGPSGLHRRHRQSAVPQRHRAPRGVRKPCGGERTSLECLSQQASKLEDGWLPWLAGGRRSSPRQRRAVSALRDRAGSASETESTVRNQRLNVPQVSTPTLNLADVGSDRIADLPSPLGWVPIPSKGSRVPVDPDREGDDHDHQTGSAPDRARRRLMHQTRRWYQQPGLCTLSEQQPHCRISFVSFLTRGSTSDWR